MSDLLFQSAQQHIPGGVNSPVRAFKSVGGSPLFIDRTEGPYVFDSEGRRYVDYVGSWGPLILGHTHPQVVEAISKGAQRFLSVGAPTQLETQIAALICELMPQIERVRLVSSGTEATMTALRLARGYTGREKILKFEGCYHGHSDSLLVKAGSGLLTLGIPTSAGIPKALAELTLVSPYNDIAALEHIFATHGDDLAGVILEPIAGNMNCIPAEPDFLRQLQALCHQHGTVLIVDEVITGFRVAFQGAKAIYPELQADLTCLGKIIGGGLPVGAVGGRKDIMDYLAPQGPVYQAGTLSGNPVCLSAGYQTLSLLKAHPERYDQLAAHTKSLCDGLTKLSREAGVPFTTQHVGSLFGLFFTDQTRLRYLSDVNACQIDQFNVFFHTMLNHGVNLAPSAYECGFVSWAHTDETLAETFTAAKQAFAAVAAFTEANAANPKEALSPEEALIPA